MVKREEGQLIGQALCVSGFGGEDGHHTLGGRVALPQAGQQQRVGAGQGARQAETFARRDVGELHEDPVKPARGNTRNDNSPGALLRGARRG